RRGDVGFRHSALQALWHWLEGKWESIDVGGNPVREDDDAREQLQLRSSRGGHFAQNRSDFRQLSEPVQQFLVNLPPGLLIVLQGVLNIPTKLLIRRNSMVSTNDGTQAPAHTAGHRG